MVKVSHQLSRIRSDLICQCVSLRCHQVDPGLLVDSRSLSDIAKRIEVKVPTLNESHGGKDRRRVDSAGESCSHRDIASQVQSDVF